MPFLQSSDRVTASAAVPSGAAWRWLPILVFLLSNTLNFLDRQLLSTTAPSIRAELGITNTQYGELLSAFSLTYALAVPFVGMFLDRVALVRGSLVAVGIWSLASAITGLTHSFAGLIGVRMLLGFGEAGALPMASKANATYLPQSEWGLASAIGSIAVTVGSVLAPLLTAAILPSYGWRSVFLISGLLGAAWLGLWAIVGRSAPINNVSSTTISQQTSRIVFDKRIWITGVSYAFAMAFYIFWLSWITLYLTQARHLTVADANKYVAWIPTLCGTAGALLSGALVFRWIRGGSSSMQSRLRVARWSAPAVLLAAFAPWVDSLGIAVLLIGIGLLFCMSIITSIGILPLDLFGRENAGFSVAMIATLYSLFQVLVSPVIGAVIDRWGFTPVCVVTPVLPLLGVAFLHLFNIAGGSEPSAKVAATHA